MGGGRPPASKIDAGRGASLRTARISVGPVFPGNRYARFIHEPWYAADPAKAGVVIYIDRRTQQAGAYVRSGGSAPEASAYSTVYEFDAIAIPENVRVARWLRTASPPAEQVSVGTPRWSHESES